MLAVQASSPQSIVDGFSFSDHSNPPPRPPRRSLSRSGSRKNASNVIAVTLPLKIAHNPTLSHVFDKKRSRPSPPQHDPSPTESIENVAKNLSQESGFLLESFKLITGVELGLYHRCGWVDCKQVLQCDHTQVMTHFHKTHLNLLSGSDDDAVKCLSAIRNQGGSFERDRFGQLKRCEEVVTKGELTRHVFETHLRGLHYHCQVCRREAFATETKLENHWLTTCPALHSLRSVAS